MTWNDQHLICKIRKYLIRKLAGNGVVIINADISILDIEGIDVPLFVEKINFGMFENVTWGFNGKDGKTYKVTTNIKH